MAWDLKKIGEPVVRDQNMEGSQVEWDKKEVDN